MLRPQWTAAPRFQRRAERQKRAILEVAMSPIDADSSQFQKIALEREQLGLVRPGTEILQRRRWNVFRESELRRLGVEARPAAPEPPPAR